VISFELTRPRLGPDLNVSLTTDDTPLMTGEFYWHDDADNQLIDDQSDSLIFLDYV